MGGGVFSVEVLRAKLDQDAVGGNSRGRQGGKVRTCELRREVLLRLGGKVYREMDGGGGILVTKW